MRASSALSGYMLAAAAGMLAGGFVASATPRSERVVAGAYLVGGVGMTLLKGGPVMMAPIRSGLGLRIGANIGYVRFTPRPTWNPF